MRAPVPSLLLAQSWLLQVLLRFLLQLHNGLLWVRLLLPASHLALFILSLYYGLLRLRLLTAHLVLFQLRLYDVL